MESLKVIKTKSKSSLSMPERIKHPCNESLSCTKSNSLGTSYKGHSSNIPRDSISMESINISSMTIDRKKTAEPSRTKKPVSEASKPVTPCNKRESIQQPVPEPSNKTSKPVTPRNIRESIQQPVPESSNKASKPVDPFPATHTPKTKPELCVPGQSNIMRDSAGTLALKVSMSLRNFPVHISHKVLAYLQWMNDISFPGFDTEVDELYNNKSIMLFHKDVRNAGAIYSSLHLAAMKKFLHAIKNLFTGEDALNDVNDFVNRVQKCAKFCEILSKIHNFHLYDLNQINMIARKRIDDINKEMMKMKIDAPAKDKKVKRKQRAVQLFCIMVSLIVNVASVGLGGTIASSLVQSACDRVGMDFNAKSHEERAKEALLRVEKERQQAQDLKTSALLTFEQLNDMVKEFSMDLLSFYKNLAHFSSSSHSNKALSLYIHTLYSEKKNIINNCMNSIKKMDEIEVDLANNGYNLKDYAHGVWLKNIAGDKFEKMEKILLYDF